MPVDAFGRILRPAHLETLMAKNQKCGKCNTVGHNRRACPTSKSTKSSIRARMERKLDELRVLERELDGATTGTSKGDIDPTGGAFCPKVPDKFGGPTRQSVVAKGAKIPLCCNFCGVWLVSPGSLKTHVGLMKRKMATTVTA